MRTLLRDLEDCLKDDATASSSAAWKNYGRRFNSIIASYDDYSRMDLLKYEGSIVVCWILCAFINIMYLLTNVKSYMWFLIVLMNWKYIFISVYISPLVKLHYFITLHHLCLVYTYNLYLIIVLKSKYWTGIRATRAYSIREYLNYTFYEIICVKLWKLRIFTWVEMNIFFVQQNLLIQKHCSGILVCCWLWASLRHLVWITRTTAVSVPLCSCLRWCNLDVQACFSLPFD